MCVKLALPPLSAPSSWGWKSVQAVTPVGLGVLRGPPPHLCPPPGAGLLSPWPGLLPASVTLALVSLFLPCFLRFSRHRQSLFQLGSDRASCPERCRVSQPSGRPRGLPQLCWAWASPLHSWRVALLLGHAPLPASWSCPQWLSYLSLTRSAPSCVQWIAPRPCPHLQN